MAEFGALWGVGAGFCLFWRKGRKGLQVGSCCWVVAVVVGTAVMVFFFVACALKGSASLALIFPFVSVSFSVFVFVFVCQAAIIIIIIVLLLRTIFTDHRRPGVSQVPRWVVTHGVVDPGAKSIIIVAGGAAELEPFPGTAAGCEFRVHELARLGQLSLLLGVGGEHAFLLRVGQHIGRIGLLEDFGQGGGRGGEGVVLQRSGVGGRVRGEVGFGAKGGRREIGEGDGWCLSIDTGVHS